MLFALLASGVFVAIYTRDAAPEGFTDSVKGYRHYYRCMRFVKAWIVIAALALSAIWHFELL